MYRPTKPVTVTARSSSSRRRRREIRIIRKQEDLRVASCRISDMRFFFCCAHLCNMSSSTLCCMRVPSRWVSLALGGLFSLSDTTTTLDTECVSRTARMLVLLGFIAPSSSSTPSCDVNYTRVCRCLCSQQRRVMKAPPPLYSYAHPTSFTISHRGRPSLFFIRLQNNGKAAEGPMDGISLRNL